MLYEVITTDRQIETHADQKTFQQHQAIHLLGEVGIAFQQKQPQCGEDQQQQSITARDETHLKREQPVNFTPNNIHR